MERSQRAGNADDGGEYFVARAKQRYATLLGPHQSIYTDPEPPMDGEYEDLIQNCPLQRALRSASAKAAEEMACQALGVESGGSLGGGGENGEEPPTGGGGGGGEVEDADADEGKSDKKNRKRMRKETKRAEKRKAKKESKRQKAAGRGVDYGKALLPGEAQGYAKYIQENKRIPRRGEIGLSAEQITKFEEVGYVMSGSRHAKMNAVRQRKESQVLSVEQARTMALQSVLEKNQREEDIIKQFKQMAAQQEAESSLHLQPLRKRR